jgi:cell division protease FtsH
LIDEEVRRIIEEAETKARTILTEHIDELHAIAKALLGNSRTLSGDEVRGPARRQADPPARRQLRPAQARVPLSRPPAGYCDSPGGFEPKPAGR